MEKLTPIEPLALKALQEGQEKGNRWAVKLFFDYGYGMPKQVKEVQLQQREMPLFFLDEDDAKKRREESLY